MTTIVLVEDHVLLAEVLRQQLAGTGRSVELVAAAGDLTEQLGAIASPDLVLLDHDLGEENPTGAELIGPLIDKGARVAMLTGVTDPVLLGRCLRAGAIGVIHKKDSFDHVIDQIESALASRPIGPSPAERSEYLARAREADSASAERNSIFERLTTREREVLLELTLGRSIGEIAQDSFVAVSTVRSQVKALRQKLGVSSQAQAVAMAADAGWFTD